MMQLITILHFFNKNLWRVLESSFYYIICKQVNKKKDAGVFVWTIGFILFVSDSYKEKDNVLRYTIYLEKFTIWSNANEIFLSNYVGNSKIPTAFLLIRSNQH